jgi:hypothetical protein
MEQPEGEKPLSTDMPRKVGVRQVYFEELARDKDDA